MAADRHASEYTTSLCVTVRHCVSLCITVCHCALVVVEEENELEGVAVASMSFNKLGEQERHLVRHRELFLSRQIETYKIDMVRYVSLSLSDLHSKVSGL